MNAKSIVFSCKNVVPGTEEVRAEQLPVGNTTKKRQPLWAGLGSRNNQSAVDLRRLAWWNLPRRWQPLRPQLPLLQLSLFSKVCLWVKHAADRAQLVHLSPGGFLRGEAARSWGEGGGPAQTLPLSPKIKVWRHASGAPWRIFWKWHQISQQVRSFPALLHLMR